LKRYAGKAVAIGKSIPLNVDNAAWYDYAGKFDTFAKNTLPNAGNTVPYGYAGKVVAIFKSSIPNPGNTVRYGYIGKTSAMGKSNLTNDDNRFSVYLRRYGYVFFSSFVSGNLYGIFIFEIFELLLIEYTPEA